MSITTGNLYVNNQQQGSQNSPRGLGNIKSIDVVTSCGKTTHAQLKQTGKIDAQLKQTGKIDAQLKQTGKIDAQLKQTGKIKLNSNKKRLKQPKVT